MNETGFLQLGEGHGFGRRPNPEAWCSWSGEGYDPTLYHVVIIGQSNANGTDAPATSTRPYLRTSYGRGEAFMLAGGVRAGTAEANLAGLRPLFEQDGSSSQGETMAWGLAYRLRELADCNLLVSVSALDNTVYGSMNRGTATYNQTLGHVRAGRRHAEQLGMPYKVLCLCVSHGEADQAFAQTGYPANLATWRTDYERDIRNITGQDGPLVMFGDQQHSGAPNASGVFAAGTGTAYGWYQAWKADPSKVILVGPRYWSTPKQADGSHIHLSQWAQRANGERFANAIHRRLFRGELWKPVAPIAGTVHRSGTTVTADFYCPTPPLRLAYDWVGRCSSPLLGFTFYDDSGSPPTVTAVSLTGNTLTLTLSGTPTGTAGSEALRGAFGSATGTASGPFRGDIRANLADSERPGYLGADLSNWCVIFHEGVT